MSKLHPLEVVSRGSETQLQVGEDHLVGKRLIEMVSKWHTRRTCLRAFTSSCLFRKSPQTKIMLQDILIYGPVCYNDRCISKPISVNNVGIYLCDEMSAHRKEDICSNLSAKDHFRSITYFFCLNAKQICRRFISSSPLFLANWVDILW